MLSSVACSLLRVLRRDRTIRTTHSRLLVDVRGLLYITCHTLDNAICLQYESTICSCYVTAFCTGTTILHMLFSNISCGKYHVAYHMFFYTILYERYHSEHAFVQLIVLRCAILLTMLLSNILLGQHHIVHTVIQRIVPATPCSSWCSPTKCTGNTFRTTWCFPTY